MHPQVTGTSAALATATAQEYAVSPEPTHVHKGVLQSSARLFSPAAHTQHQQAKLSVRKAAERVPQSLQNS